MAFWHFMNIKTDPAEQGLGLRFKLLAMLQGAGRMIGNTEVHVGLRDFGLG